MRIYGQKWSKNLIKGKLCNFHQPCDTRKKVSLKIMLIHLSYALIKEVFTKKSFVFLLLKVYYCKKFIFANWKAYSFKLILQKKSLQLLKIETSDDRCFESIFWSNLLSPISIHKWFEVKVKIIIITKR